MPKIQALEPQVAELIAAGEVVERPASVVKELIENSMDAGASVIKIEIRRGGAEMIRIQDNGIGIAPEDLPTAFLRHATSKLRKLDDLSKLQTLGFRGEALAAICAVSRVEIVTREKGALSGALLKIEGGVQDNLEEAGTPEGTVITVRDLFYNTPARLKFMRKENAEAAAIGDLIRHLALSRPDISFEFRRDNMPVLHTPGDGQLISAIYAALGRDFASGLIPADGHGGEIQIEGFITIPTQGRGSRSMQTFFINHRYIKSQLLTTALEEAYRNQLLKGRFPGCVLLIQLPADQIDVNVHPAKTQIKFAQEREVFDIVYHTALEALMAHGGPIPAPGHTNGGFFRSPGHANGDILKGSGHADGDFFRRMDAQTYRARMNGAEQKRDIEKRGGKPDGVEIVMDAGKPRLKWRDTRDVKSPGFVTGFSDTESALLSNGNSEPEEPPPGWDDEKNAPPPDWDSKPEEPPPGWDDEKNAPPDWENEKNADLNQDDGQETPEDEGLSQNKNPSPCPPSLSGTGERNPGKFLLNGKTEAEKVPPERGDLGGFYFPDKEKKEDGQEKIAAVTDEETPWRMIGEAFRTYLICECGDDIWLIDKHAAHERINFDKLREAREKPMRQTLLVSQAVELAREDALILLENLDVLDQMGFACEDFGDGSILIREIPDGMDPEEIAAALEELAEDFKTGRSAEERRDAALKTVACKMSIKGGWENDERELYILMEKVRSGEIRYCPHGRPVAVKITKRELEKKFKRII